MRIRKWFAAAACLIALACSAVVLAVSEKRLAVVVVAALGAAAATALIMPAGTRAAAPRLSRNDALATNAVAVDPARLVLDEIPGLVSTLLPDGRVELANRQALEFHGRSAAEIREWSNLVHPEDYDRFVEEWRDAAAVGRCLDIELRTRKADGTYRWMAARFRPQRDARGHVVRWCTVLADIDDRKRAEDALRSSEQSLRLILDRIPGFICTNTAAGEVEHMNKTLLDYAGEPLGELRNWPVVVHPEDLPTAAEHWERSIATGMPFNVEVRVRRADGVYRWFQCRHVAMRDAEGRVIRWYGLFIDVDERVKAEEALRDTRARLARASQVATVGELSAAIAHEINQPLAAVLANADACNNWLTANPPNLPRVQLSLERIIRNGRAAADVIERIRALYRHAPPSKDALCVNEVIEEACRLIEIEARRRSIALRTELARPLPPLLADRTQLQQVLANLTRNAMEAMELVTDRPHELLIESVRDNGKIVIRVQDTGVGVPDVASAFEPFFTTKSNGMGMGLAICRSIIEAHGGQMWAAAADPRGSIFSFSLPAAEAN